MAMANKADASMQAECFSSNDSDFLAIVDQAGKSVDQAEKFSSDDSDFRAIAEGAQMIDSNDSDFQAMAEQMENTSLESGLRKNDSVRPKLRTGLKSNFKRS